MWKFLLLVLHQTQLIYSANILVINSVYGGSHEAVLWQISKHLAQQNYSVTFLRFRHSDEESYTNAPNINVEQLDLTNPYSSTSYANNYGILELPKDILWQRKRRVWSVPMDSYTILMAYCHSLLGNALLLDKLKKVKYDVAVVDLLINDCGLALTYELYVPVVGFWGGPATAGPSNIVAGFISPSIKPIHMSEVTDLTVFSQRLWNFVIAMVDLLATKLTQEISYKCIKKHFPESPHPMDTLLDVNLLLSNSHELLEYPGVRADNTFTTGCLSCEEPKQLPQDLEAWLRSGSYRKLVIFSLGMTGYSSAVVPQQFVNLLMKAFSLISYKVVMRFNASYVNMKIPNNVLVLDKIPQNDLLGNANTVAFVTHCGIKSYMEAVYHKVPMVALPIFGDQGDNAERMRAKGIAVVLDKDTLTAKQLAGAIIQVAEKKQYKKSISDLSNIMKGYSKEPPMSKVVRLIKMVEKHKDLKIFKPSTRTLFLFQHLLIDVFLLITAILLLTWYTAKQISSFCSSRIKTKEKLE